MENKLLQLPGTITSVKTMANKVLRLQVDTQENLTKEQMAKIMQNNDEYGYFCFLVGEKEIDEKEIIDLPPLPKDETEVKSPSQRLRSRMFVFYMNTHIDKERFNTWYADTLEKLGQQYLNKIEE